MARLREFLEREKIHESIQRRNRGYMTSTVIYRRTAQNGILSCATPHGGAKNTERERNST